jgi:rSAM/selenodomain-associated transferase 2
VPLPDRILSFVVPALDEARTLIPFLGPLAASLRPAEEELVVVDGGSRDGTVERARSLGGSVRVIASPRGRARQMNAGARAARGRLLVFAHADTRFSPGALEELRSLARAEGTRWGYFPVALDERGVALRLIELGIKARERAGFCATGDQAIFVARSVFLALGGFPDVPLMEDVEFTRRLARIWRPRRPRASVVTSARRWTRRGIVRTQLRMWALRLAWRAGASHDWLATFYPVVR